MLPRNAAGAAAKVSSPVWAAEYGFGTDNRDGTATFGFDLVVLKNLFQRWIPAQIQAAQELGQRVIIDVDDLYSDIHDANVAKGLLDPATNKVRNWDHYDETIRVADAVTVSTPKLLEAYGPIACDIRLIRNGISPVQFSPIKHVKARKPVLGWAGGMGWRSNDIEELRPWLNDFLEEHDLQFHHVGSDPGQPVFSDVAGVDPSRMILTGMQPIATYASALTFDIGLVPLADIPFNHAKSNIKGLEYAAAGIPFVASYSPEYQRLSDMGVGHIARTAADWQAELTALLDFDVRRKEATRQRKLVLSQHTIRETAPDWVRLFRDVAGNCRVPTVRLKYVAI